MNPWFAVMLVAGGGAVGALLRWAIALLLAPASNARFGGFPFATMLVNVVGAFALAWLVTAAGGRSTETAPIRLFLGTGVLGAFTTFSTLGVDALGLVQVDRGEHAALYVGGTLILGALGVMAGWWLGR